MLNVTYKLFLIYPVSDDASGVSFNTNCGWWNQPNVCKHRKEEHSLVGISPPRGNEDFKYYENLLNYKRSH